MTTSSKIRLPIQLQQSVMSCLRENLQLANQRLNSQYLEPTIVYRKKGTIAGTAHLTEWMIQLNSLLLLENGQPFIEEVVPHELAHLLVFQHFGKVKPHGKEWQWMMKEILGKAPQRTHHFSVKNSQKITYNYKCACQIHQLSTIRHNRIKNNKLNYICKKCGSTLLPETPK